MNFVRHNRKFQALVLLLLFVCYYSGISLFSHVHIVNGSSIVHSHLGSEAGHEHSDSQYAVIDFLSQFQSEEPGGFISTAEPFFSLSELCAERPQQVCLMDVDRLQDLRGPPQA